MHRPAALAAALLVCAAPASAIDGPVHFTCDLTQSCRVGEACLYADTSFTMVLEEDERLSIILEGATSQARYDTGLRTAAFRANDTVYQLRFTGADTGVVFATQDGQSFEQSQVFWLTCESS